MGVRGEEKEMGQVNRVHARKTEKGGECMQERKEGRNKGGKGRLNSVFYAVDN